MTAPPPRRRWRSASRPGFQPGGGAAVHAAGAGGLAAGGGAAGPGSEVGPASAAGPVDGSGSTTGPGSAGGATSTSPPASLAGVVSPGSPDDRARRSGGRERRAGRSRCRPTRDTATVRSGRGRPARPPVGRGRRLGHDDRHHDVEPEEQAPCHEHQDDPDDPDERRVEVEPLGHAAGDPGEDAFVARAIQAIVHRQPPAGIELDRSRHWR